MTELKNFFDIANNINTSTTLLSQEEVEAVGNQYMLNRAMSNNFDTVFFADEANGFVDVPMYPQYLFYFYSIPKKKRYGKWEKKGEKPEHLDLIKKTYNVSDKRALEYLSLLTDEQISYLEKRSQVGGKLNKEPKKTSKKK
ncbi:MAG TPA: DNA polymerase clamp loader subunit A [Methanosarcina sp.]|nr:DNA polymerase clamp loader subunit A [Methanosarcina sp.]